MTNETADRPAWADPLPWPSHYLDINGSRLHYLDVGQGPTILFLHGNPVWSYVHRNVIDALSEQFRCVAPDLPGFGLSAAADGYGFTPQEHISAIEEFVVALDLSDVTLMANDWGGPIGLEIASRHSDRFTGLILGNTWAWPAEDKASKRFSKIMGGAVGGFLNRNFNFFVRMALRNGLKRHKLTAEDKAAYFGPFAARSSRRAPTVFARSIAAEADLLASVESKLAMFRTTPTLILWPDQDFAFGPEHLTRWREELPAARVIEIENCGHYIQQDAPDDVARHTIEWFATRDTSQ